jgi:hypothetical protein
MKTLTILAILCFSVSSFSKNVELDIVMTLKKNNETQTSKMKVVAKLGESFEIPFQNDKSFKLKMKATDKFTIPEEVRKQHKGEMISDLMISGTVFEKRNGKEEIIANPLIISNYKQQAIIEVRNEKGEVFEMKVTPTLKL